MQPHEQPITVTQSDLTRLERLIAQSEDGPNATLAEQLELELTRARVLPSEQVPADLVTMNSLVVFEDEETGARRQVTLCYPRDATSGPDRVSVLAPVGAALLGLRVGESIAWPVPGGRTRRLRIVAVPYQPEAAGHLDL